MIIRTNDKWEDGEVVKLKRLLDLGLTIEEISRVLQRSVLGVLYKMWRENMPAQAITLNMRSMTVKKLLKCRSGLITGICKELFDGDFTPGRQEFVLRVLLTLDMCHDEWVAKKREEQAQRSKWFLDIETISPVAAFADFEALEKAIHNQLFEQAQREENRKNMQVVQKFAEFVTSLSLELQVPPCWTEHKINEILNQ